MRFMWMLTQTGDWRLETGDWRRATLATTRLQSPVSCFPSSVMDIGAESNCIAQVDVSVERARGAELHLEQRPQAPRHRARNRNLGSAKERDIDPAHLARRQGGERGVQV